MATTGTTTFDLNFVEIAEEAWERAGREMRTGYDLRTTRRSLNLLTMEWANRGVNMWTLDEATIALTSGTATYNLPTDTVDVLEAVVRENAGNASTQTDLSISRLSMPDYLAIPNKLISGRPINMFVERSVATPTVTFWPVPNNSDYTFVYWRLRRIEDTGKGVETHDVPFRFLPALVSGLAYYIACKIPEGQTRLDKLKADYGEQFLMASQEDRERSTLRIVPRRQRL